VSLTIVGVAPARFTGLLAGLSPDLWSPFMMASTVLHDPEWHTRTGSFSLFGVGRLKPGVNAARAEAELTALTRQLEEMDPRNNRNYAAAVFPSTMIPTPFRGFVAGFTSVLMVAVFMVLLIACANAANLMLGRAVSRRREFAVRASIGASRLRLMRQLLTESVLLALLGGGLGLLLTNWFVPVLLRLTPPTLPIRPEVGLDVRVFAFTALVSLLTGLVFGLAPALQGTKVNLASALKDESPATGAKRSRFASTLIVGQMAGCLVLLIAGALCLRSLFNAQNVKLGFQMRNRVTAEVNLKDYGYSAEQVRSSMRVSLGGSPRCPASNRFHLLTIFRWIQGIWGFPTLWKDTNLRQVRALLPSKPSTWVQAILRPWEPRCSEAGSLPPWIGKAPRTSRSSTRRWPSNSGPDKTRLAIG
jgi:putative ABC transport system permease protein